MAALPSSPKWLQMVNVALPIAALKLLQKHYLTTYKSMFEVSISDIKINIESRDISSWVELSKT
jgi:hypothetical protein